MLRSLSRCEPGTVFRVPGMKESATLIKINECRAHVKVHGPDVKREFETRGGKFVEFVAPGGRKEDWAPSVLVGGYSKSRKRGLK